MILKLNQSELKFLFIDNQNFNEVNEYAKWNNACFVDEIVTKEN